MKAVHALRGVLRQGAAAGRMGTAPGSRASGLGSGYGYGCGSCRHELASPSASSLWGVSAWGAHRAFAAQAAEVPAGKLVLNFVVPDKAIKAKAHVDMVVVPATRGEMGILAEHVPTVAQLQPGVVAVHSGTEIEKYFISSGFAFINPECTDVCAVSAVPVSDIIPEEVTNGLAEAEAAMSAATDEVARAEAQIGIDVFSAMRDAMSGK